LFLAIIISPSHTQSDLNLTVKTHRTAYYIGDNVQIYGNLTFNNETVSDGLVAVEVNDARGTPLIIRTLTTGTKPQMAWYVYVGMVFASDQQGNPKNNFYRGDLAYFNITIVNNDVEPRLTLVTVTALDNNQVPMGSASIKTTLPGQTYIRFIISIPVPTDATLGTATAYVNAYTEWPMIQGTPYCPERNATFNIVSAGAASTAASTATTTIQQATANYNLTFKLPNQITIGNFTAYVSSTYQGFTAFNSTTFQIKILGDINGDNTVNYWDLFFLAKAYGSHEGDPKYNPEADFNHDGNVNYWDLFILAKNYGKSA
jgi:hypothetical protein